MRILLKIYFTFTIVSVFTLCLVGQSAALILSGTGWSTNTIDASNSYSVTTGGVQEAREILTTVPTDLGMDTYYNIHQEGLNEKQNYTLTEDLKLNKDVTIKSGVTINSHLVFFNHADGIADNLKYSFADFDVDWVFDSVILGITYDPQSVWEYESRYLGLDNVDYGYDDFYDNPNGVKSYSGRGIESKRDSYTISGNTLTFNSFVQQPGDYMRIITATPIPEPTTSLLFGIGALLISGAMRRRNNS